mgnify:CR=1 FL=1
MAFISDITDGELGSSVRSKLNELITLMNNNTGWAQYNDTAYSAGSPLVINQGTTTGLLNNKGSVIESHLPQGVTTLYDGSRITPSASGDAYDLRIGFTAECSSVNGAFATSLDISELGNGSNKIFERASATIRGANTPQKYVFATNIYSLGTFLANGGKVLFEAISGNFEIYDISFVITKTHSARV